MVDEEIKSIVDEQIKANKDLIMLVIGRMTTFLYSNGLIDKKWIDNDVYLEIVAIWTEHILGLTLTEEDGKKLDGMWKDYEPIYNKRSLELENMLKERVKAAILTFVGS